jgi:hypothetical protein
MIMHESQTVRWLVIAVLGTATVGMTLVSMRANYLFGYGFGQTPDKATVFGWANVAADLWKVAGLIVIARLWRARQWRIALCLAPIWLICLLWGLVGAIGIYAQDRTALIGGRLAVAANQSDLVLQLEEIDAKLKVLQAQRSVAQVDTAIAAVLARPVTIEERVRGTVGKLSDGCKKETRATAEACLEFASLRQERAAAEERSALESRQAGLRLRVAHLRERGASAPADPVAELFAWLSRGQLSVRDVSFGFPLVFALLIEMVSAIGPAGIVAYADATRQVKASHGQTELGRGRHAATELDTQSVGSVLDWVADRGTPTSDSKGISCEELHQDYTRWCNSMKAAALELQAFGVEFDRVREVRELRGKIRKFGNRYYGIKLADKKVALLVTRR